MRLYRDHLLTTAVVAAIATSLPAQQQFVPLRPQLPAGHDCVVQVAGDVDGDGDLDLICMQLQAYYGPSVPQVFLNDGRGAFFEAPAGSLPVSANGDIVLGDVDGDGDLDLVSVNSQTRNGLFLNNGQGVFTDVSAVNMPLDTFWTRDGTLIDADGDGDLDLVCASATSSAIAGGAQNRLYTNNGSGVFTDETSARMPSVASRTIHVVSGDFDGDGDEDLFCANGSIFFEQNRLYRNDGSGVFVDVTTAQLPIMADATWNAVTADFDGDGDLDIACGGDWGWNRLLINDGTGTFTDETAMRLPNDFENTRFIAGDIDDDGDVDLIAVNAGFCTIFQYPSYCQGQQNKLYLNDGTGTFADATSRLPTACDRTWGGVLGDVDADGDLDLVAGNVTGGWHTQFATYPFVQETTVLLNVQRQLNAPSSPQVGHPYTLDAYLRHGPASTIDLAAIYVSTAPGSIPLPFGTLGIDPALAAPFPTLVIPQPTGVGSAGLAIPNVPGLIGQVIYSQAMLVAYPSDLRLTNVVRDVIAP